ncbi:MAG: tetratricopeptide repeat protein, partial [Pseudomonadota bacterium]
HLSRMEAYGDAETLLNGYAALKPNDATVLMALARIHEAAGEPEKAEETLLQLMDMSEENDAELTQQLVSVQVSLEKYADALENADSLLEQDPANIAVRELRVDALMELDREDEAQEERERISKLQPELATSGEPAATDFAEAAP